MVPYLKTIPAQSLPLCAKINEERPQPGKSETGIHVILNHIKREIVKSAKAPYSDNQEGCDPESGLFQNKQNRSGKSDEQK
jgi:hypothetical protein